MDFPLKTDFFPQVRLSPEERSKYLRTAEASAVALRRALDSSDWTKLFDKDGASFSKMHCIDEHQQTRGGAATACLAVCATIFTPGTISEVLEAIASPVTDDYRKAMKFLYKNRFLDGLALHTIAAQNAQAFTTIKWAAFDDGRARNSPKFPTGSDYCFLEHAGIQREDSAATAADDDSDNNAAAPDNMFGFSVQESIVREREVPSLAGFGLRRGEFHRTGIIILPTERRDVVQVSSILQMRLLGSDSAANKAALERLMLKRVEAVRRVDLLLERRRLSKMQFVNRDEWVADEDRKSCAVCVKPFSIRRRHHCRNCGEVVCSACAPPREVDVSSFGSALIRICTACVVQARSEPQQQQAQAGADVFVYHVRSTLSSRASTNSSDMTMEAELGCAVRPHSFGSESNFSIASEYQHGVADFFPPPPQQAQQQQQQQPLGYSSFMNPYGVTMGKEFDADKYYSRDSQSSSDGSSYSFSDYNTFDDRFGSVMMKRLAPPPPQVLPARATGKRHVLFHEPLPQQQSRAPATMEARVVYNPSKVMTHLLTNDESPQRIDGDESETKPEASSSSSSSSSSAGAAGGGGATNAITTATRGGVPQELTSSFQSTGSMDEDIQECVRGLHEDISRATKTRFSDLEMSESFYRALTSFHNDLLSPSADTTHSAEPVTTVADAATAVATARPPSPPPAPHAHSAPPSARGEPTASLCSSPSTVDVDIDLLLSSDDFSLLCQETLQRQRRSSSATSFQQVTVETRGTGAVRTTTTPSKAASPLRMSRVSQDSISSVLLDDDEDLLALRLHVEGLHKSLEAATSKLNYYQSLSSTRSTRSQSTDRDVAVAPLPPVSAPATAAAVPVPVSAAGSRWSRRRGSTQSSSSSNGSGCRGDPVFSRRTVTYDALVSELHELMGLPTLSPRAA